MHGKGQSLCGQFSPLQEYEYQSYASCIILWLKLCVLQAKQSQLTRECFAATIETIDKYPHRNCICEPLSGAFIFCSGQRARWQYSIGTLFGTSENLDRYRTNRRCIMLRCPVPHTQVLLLGYQGICSVCNLVTTDPALCANCDAYGLPACIGKRVDPSL